MAIGYDNSSLGSSAAGAASLTFSHTCGSLVNGLIVVLASYYNGANSITTITYNGVALTAVRRDNPAGAAATEVWYLVAPASGANNVIITFGSGNSGGSGVSAAAISLSGIDQASPIDGQNGSGAAAGGTSQSTSVTTVADSAWLLDILTEDKSPTVGGSQTQRQNALNTNGNRYYAASTRGPISPAASTAMSWSFAAAGVAVSQSVVSVKPAAAAGLSIPVAMADYRRRRT
jgi:hypothetical protein